MNLPPLLEGIGIGLTVAAPVGPMSVLCMRRTLTAGWRLGLCTGLGIATGDGIYAFVAALGLAGVSRFMLSYERPLHFVAGLFLLYLGARTFFERATATATPQRAANKTAYTGALLLTLTNLPTIVAFAAIFTVFAPSSGFGASASAATVAGVFLGSALWWLILTAAVTMVRHAVGLRMMKLIDRVSGMVLGLFGMAEIRRAL